jgi:hypothetical protein
MNAVNIGNKYLSFDSEGMPNSWISMIFGTLRIESNKHMIQTDYEFHLKRSAVEGREDWPSWTEIDSRESNNDVNDSGF